jgi:hypothetical protein
VAVNFLRSLSHRSCSARNLYTFCALSGKYRVHVQKNITESSLADVKISVQNDTRTGWLHRGTKCTSPGSHELRGGYL